LVKKASDWEFSSLKEYVGLNGDNLCEFKSLLDIKPDAYAKFVEDRADYQKALAKIKKLTIDEQKTKSRVLKLP